MKHFSQQCSILFILAILLSFYRQAFPQNNSAFELRRQKYISKDGKGFESCGQSIWAWLENNDQAKMDQISEIIRTWGQSRDWKDWVRDPGKYCYAWRTGIDLTSIFLIRILLQYPDRISDADRAFLQNKFDYSIRSKYFFHKGSMNNRLMDFVARYLYSERQPSVTVQYGDVKDDKLDLFSYNGKTYIPGNEYNSLQLARDWLFWKFDNLVKIGDNELDSWYTPTFITSLYTLYDFAIDPEVKKRSKMILELILLDSILDTSANSHGGYPGRSYGDQIMSGTIPNIYHWPYWGIGIEPTASSWSRFYYDVYVSSYRLPALIEDVGILDDEPDNYWHFNKENNYAGYIPKNQGKWNFVTKFYNLGGATKGWMLNIKTNDSPDGRPIRMWINDNATISDPLQGKEYYIQYGKGGYQYKNAMLIKIETPYLHILGAGNVFDVDEVISDWRFLKEGNVAVALQLNPGSSALEVAILGVDYNSYADFKNAIIRKAQLTNTFFKTSKGDLITAKGDLAYANGKLVTKFPFKRLETELYTGQKLISWQNNVMIVQRHGRKIVYDFNRWKFSTDGQGPEIDLTPPGPPTNIKVKVSN